MLDLDIMIWQKYYPEQNIKDIEIPLQDAHLWLKNDIIFILSDKEISPIKAEEGILSFIFSTAYADVILTKYIILSSIREEIAIRRNFLAALKKSRTGDDLAVLIHYALSKKDLAQLAKLHKANKYSKKILRIQMSGY